MWKGGVYTSCVLFFIIPLPGALLVPVHGRQARLFIQVAMASPLPLLYLKTRPERKTYIYASATQHEPAYPTPAHLHIQISHRGTKKKASHHHNSPSLIHRTYSTPNMIISLRGPLPWRPSGGEVGGGCKCGGVRDARHLFSPQRPQRPQMRMEFRQGPLQKVRKRSRLPEKGPWFSCFMTVCMVCMYLM